MVDTVYDASGSLSNSSSDSSDSEDPPENSYEDPSEDHPDSTPMASLDDMEMDLPEEDPDPPCHR